MHKILTFGRDYPRLTGIFLFLLTALSLYRLPRLEFDFTLDRLLMDGDPRAAIYTETTEVFGSDNITTVYIRDENLFSAEKLKLIRESIRDIEKLEKVSKVESLFNSTSFSNVGDTLSTLPLFDVIPEEQAEIDTLVAVAHNNPLFNKKLIAEKGKVIGLQVHAIVGDHDAEFNRHLSESLEVHVQKLKPHFDDVFQLGTPIIYDSIGQGIIGDQKLLLPLIFFVIAASMFYFLRMFSGAFLPLATGALSLLWTLGFMTYVDIPGHLLISMMPLMLFIIGATEDTHIMSEYIEGLEHEGDRSGAITYFAKKIVVAILMTSATTIIGFATVTVNKIIMLKEFGLVLAVGLFFNFIVTVLFIPWFLSFFGEKKSPFAGSVEDNEKFSAKLFRKLADIIYSVTLHRKALLILSIIIYSAFTLYHGQDVKADNGALSNFKADSEIRRDVVTFNESFPGITNFYITLKAEGSKPFRKHQNLQKVLEIFEFIEHSKVWGGARSFAEMIALVNRELNEGKPEEFRIPDNDALISQYLLFFTRPDMEHFVSADYSRANIVVNHQIISSHKYIEELEVLKGQLTEMLAGTGITFDLTAKSILNAEAGETIVTSQIESIILTVFMIFILMAILFWSFKVALLSIVPNVLPIFGFFGFMGLFDIPLNIGTSVIAVISIGIAVDDTIHFFFRFNEYLKEFGTKEEALRATLKAETRPMVTTSLSLALGLSLAGLASFVPIIAMGTLTALVMVFALISDLFVTPQVLMSGNFKGFVTVLDLWACKVPSQFWKITEYMGQMSVDEAKRLLLGVKIIANRRREPKPVESPEFFVLRGRVELVRKASRQGEEGELISVRALEAGAMVREKTDENSYYVLTTGSEIIPIDRVYLKRFGQIFPSRLAEVEKKFPEIAAP